MDLNISTGPVVPFRATKYLLNSKESGSVPLLWIQHIKTMQTKFPIDTFRKQQWIYDTDQSKKLLVKNQNMILMRRFSPKEDFRRMTVSPFNCNDYKYESIGLENHLNYIYRQNKELTLNETWGLSAYLNSNIFDSYFRIINGNTQVSATELRSAPLPEKDKIIEIGSLIRKAASNSHENIDAIVNNVLDLEEIL